MDAVITYVNGSDPIWQQSYMQATSVPAITKRYRDWDTLRYLLRGIRVNMPFIDKVFLVVSGPSQVPSWADTSSLQIVLHSDIIPQQYLPTFNSTTIEMFLHRIPGLSEEYLYFNDDVFPMLPCAREDFFQNGRNVIGFRKCIFACGQFKKQTRNSHRLALDALDRGHGLLFIRPQHTCTPMLRTACQKAFAAVESEILSRLSPLRTDFNVCQYFFLDYIKESGLTVEKEISNKHMSLSVVGENSLRSYFARPTHKLLCINDTAISPEKEERFRKLLPELFSRYFPEKSDMEL